MTIEAINTPWRGYNFRSRLEARWAVFFDALGIAWEYEAHGFDTEHGRYLPDFFLPTIRSGLWVEVKPKGNPDEDTERTEALLKSVVLQTGLAGTIVRGDPRDAQATPAGDWSSNVIYEAAWIPMGGADSNYRFCLCPVCRRIGFEYEGRGERVCASAGAECSVGPADAYTFKDALIVGAADAARSARFEHGEAPP